LPGIADPSPIAQAFIVPPASLFTRIDAIVTVVDAEYGRQHLKESRPKGRVNEAVEQVLYADRVIVNKVDLVVSDNIHFWRLGCEI
jgi:G3E family GTPase